MLQQMLDTWHQKKMQRLLQEEVQEKKLNDKIMSFAERQQKVTETVIGKSTHQLKAISKKGQQKYKYQEILRRQQAIADMKR